MAALLKGNVDIEDVNDKFVADHMDTDDANLVVVDRLHLDIHMVLQDSLKFTNFHSNADLL